MYVYVFILNVVKLSGTNECLREKKGRDQLLDDPHK